VQEKLDIATATKESVTQQDQRTAAGGSLSTQASSVALATPATQADEVGGSFLAAASSTHKSLKAKLSSATGGSKAKASNKIKAQTSRIVSSFKAPTGRQGFHFQLGSAFEDVHWHHTGLVQLAVAYILN